MHNVVNIAESNWLLLFPFLFRGSNIPDKNLKSIGYKTKILSKHIWQTNLDGTSHQYTITLYTSGHLQISWDVFAKKSADILSFRNSFITISSLIEEIMNLSPS